MRQDVLEYRRGHSKRIYPYEKPRRRDLELWIGALKLVTSPLLTLSYALGEYVTMPPRHDGWFAKADYREVYCVLDNSTYDVYICEDEELRWQRLAYEWNRNEDGMPDASSLLASVEIFDDWFVILLSTATVPHHVVQRQSFLELLRSSQNQSLWKYSPSVMGKESGLKRLS